MMLSLASFLRPPNTPDRIWSVPNFNCLPCRSGHLIENRCKSILSVA